MRPRGQLTKVLRCFHVFPRLSQLSNGIGGDIQQQLDRVEGCGLESMHRTRGEDDGGGCSVKLRVYFFWVRHDYSDPLVNGRGLVDASAHL